MVCLNASVVLSESIMSNATIISRMREACDQFEAGRIRTYELCTEFVGLASALEHVCRVPRRDVTADEEFTSRRMGIEDELEIPVQDQFEYVPNEEAPALRRPILEDIRAWLARLSTG